ncbi:MAG TPA: ATP-binding protein [Myxococcota bacterium]|nr:ATP-binding protein [Myxococcota bacterium]
MKRRSIATTLIVLVALALSVVLGIEAWYTSKSLERALIQEAFDGLHRTSDTIKRGLRYAMLHDDNQAVTESIRTFGQQEGIDGIRVFNKDGEVMFSSWEQELGNRVDTTADACKGCHSSGRPLASLGAQERTNIYVGTDGVRRFQVIEPIYNERDCSTAECHAHSADRKVLGVMESAISLERIDREIARRRAGVLTVTIVTIVLVSLLIFLMTRQLVLRPIRRLLEGTRVIASGRLDHRIPVRLRNELGELAESFNAMTKSLQDTRGQLLQSERLSSLGRLSAGIAHEINNPITGILLTATTMLEEAPAGSKERENLELVVRETQRCRDIVRGLLDFARQAPFAPAPGDLREVVGRAVQIVAAQAELAKIPIRVNLPDLPRAAIDAKQMQQVFLNLLVNALDAMPDGGAITIDGRVEDGDVVVDVSDTGMGIPPEHRARLFEPFFSTKESKGTGLGLAIVWGIVEQHGGRIDVQSVVGRGTTFSVRVPVAGATSR